MNELSQLITKDQAAALLGVSRATFDRAREGLGLRPVPSARKKPIYFDRAAVEAARNGNGAGTEAQEAYLLPTNGTLVIKHDLPPARTAKEMLATLKPQIRKVKKILADKGIVSMKRLHAESAKGRKARGK